MKRLRCIFVACCLLYGGSLFAQEVVDLMTWNGNKRSWEMGTETRINEQTIVPMVGAVSSGGNNMIRLYPTPNGFTQNTFRAIPEGVARPIRDTSLYTFVANDSTVWVEYWPSTSGPAVLQRLTGLPPAHYTFDFGGISGLDQRWQWMMTYENSNNITSLYETSYSTPELMASFPGRVVVEPAVQETRVSGQWTEFQVRFAWPMESMEGMVVLLDGATVPDTILWAAPYLPSALAYSPRMINSSEPTLYGIVPVSGNSYSLYHQAGDYGCLYRRNIDSQVPPRLFTTTEYQKVNLLDGDFVAWVERVNGLDVIKWVRFQYQFSYTNPEMNSGQIIVDGSINRLRAQYASGVDEFGPFDSWYLVWSEYDDESDVTYLRSKMADRNPWNSTSVEPEDAPSPLTITLHPAYPNPFNASTVIPFELSRAGHVRISVVDLLGREVATLTDGLVPTGKHSLSWQPSRRLASGSYLVRLEQEGNGTVQRIQLVK